AQIENDVRALESAIAWVTFTLDVPKATLDDVRSTSRGASIKNRYDLASNSVKLGIHPGDHTFTVTSEDGKERTWKVTLANGSTQDHAFEFTKEVGVAPPPPPPRVTRTARPIPLSVKVMAGVTGALAVGTGVMMGVAVATKGDYEKINGTTNDKALIHGK